MLMAIMMLSFFGCDMLNVKQEVWYYGSGDLTVTNITTGVTVQKTFNGSIIINGEEIKYEITAKCGDEIEVLYTSPRDKANDSFEVEFELFGEKKVAPYTPPYKISYVINNDVVKGKYAVKCSAFCKSQGYGETQVIDVIVE